MVIGNDRLLLDPRTQFSTNWDIYVAILLIATIFTMPLSMAFETMQTSLLMLDLLADVTFVLDIMKVRRFDLSGCADLRYLDTHAHTAS